MTNEELLAAMTALVARAESAASNANTAASSANAAAGQASEGAAAGVAAGRTQSNVEYGKAQVDSDVGIEESWAVNNKRTYDLHQTYDMEAALRNRTHFDNAIAQLHTHLANVNHLTLQSLANNQNQSNLNNTLSIDRSWNINETDAYASMTAAKIADILFAKAKAPAA